MLKVVLYYCSGISLVKCGALVSVACRSAKCPRTYIGPPSRDIMHIRDILQQCSMSWNIFTHIKYWVHFSSEEIFRRLVLTKCLQRKIYLGTFCFREHSAALQSFNIRYVRRPHNGLAASLKIGVFADKKVIIPFYLFPISANWLLFSKICFLHIIIQIIWAILQDLWNCDWNHELGSILHIRKTCCLPNISYIYTKTIVGGTPPSPLSQKWMPSP